MNISVFSENGLSNGESVIHNMDFSRWYAPYDKIVDFYNNAIHFLFVVIAIIEDGCVLQIITV